MKRGRPLVDPLAALDDKPGGGEVMALERMHRVADRGLGEPAHLGDERAQLADIVVECLDRMIAALNHASLPQP